MFNIKNEGQKASVYLYGTIGRDYWSEDDENTAKDFAKTLDELSPLPLDIHIDSLGGDVYEAFAIASAIERYEGMTTTYIDGVAASAASYIAVMSNRVVMNDFSQFMIHCAWTYARGNSKDFLNTAERLEAMDSTIAGLLSARSGLTNEEVLEAMEAETWYSARAAKEVGFCDEVIETQERTAASLDHLLMQKSHEENKVEPKAKRLELVGNTVLIKE